MQVKYDMVKLDTPLNNLQHFFISSYLSYFFLCFVFKATKIFAFLAFCRAGLAPYLNCLIFNKKLSHMNFCCNAAILSLHDIGAAAAKTLAIKAKYSTKRALSMGPP